MLLCTFDSITAANAQQVSKIVGKVGLVIIISTDTCHIHHVDQDEALCSWKHGQDNQ